jgi:NADH:ubiquinone oxidoreductase subunit K
LAAFLGAPLSAVSRKTNTTRDRVLGVWCIASVAGSMIAEAALALGLVVLLYRRRETLSAEAWQELHEQ